MERNPHLLIEGCAIGCYAIGAKVAYIYIRGEFFHVQHGARARDRRGLRAGLSSARTSSAPASTATSTSTAAPAPTRPARRRRCSSRSKASARSRATSRRFPAVVGLYGKPTAVNNVETLCNVPLDRARTAPEWYAALGPEKNGGPKLYCVSGHVKRPGVYEASMNITLRELIDGHAGGVRDGRTLKAVIPGGSSVPILLPDQLDTPASFDARAEGRLAARLGRRSSCSTTRPAWSGWPRTCCTSTATSRAASARRAARAPTGCYKILQRIERGEGQMRDLDLLSSVSNNIAGKTLCAFGDAAVDAGADDAEAFPARVRGAHHGRALHAAGRLAGAAARWDDALIARDRHVLVIAADHRAARR